MCGVIAQLNFQKNSSPLQLQESMKTALSLLSHRGPDFSNQYWSDDFICGLGHTRLSIQDLSDASHQPFCYDNLVLSFNGEIYNFLDIRLELQSLGYQFNTSGDTEVLLFAYHHWKERCFEKFNGMWAIAIWDTISHSLIISRDRLGVKPLYYRHDSRTFICASEIGAFSPFMAFEAQFNTDYLNTALQLGTVAESLPDTLIQGVFKFPPGHFARIDFQTGTLDLQRWWHPEELSISCATDYELRVEQFRELFNDALEIRNISDAKLAIALSGGLDSGSVAASMRNPFIAFTCDFKHAVSEVEDAALIMRTLNGEHKQVPCYRPSLKHMLRCTINLEDVSPDSHVGLDMIYEQMSAEGIKVSIEGHGGDELLAGYHHYHLCDLASRLKRSVGEQSFFQTLDSFRQHTAEHAGQSILEAMLLNQQTLSAASRHLGGRIGSIESDTYSSPVAKAETWNDFLKSRLHNDLFFNTLPAILRNFDKLSMRHGIEIRSPFLDYRLVQFCRGLPDEDMLYQGFTKRILRDAMPELPDAIRFQKRKLGFVSPFVHWCKAVELNEWQWLLEILMRLPAGVDPVLLQSVQSVIQHRNFAGIRQNWAQICAILFFARFKGVITNADLY